MTKSLQSRIDIVLVSGILVSSAFMLAGSEFLMLRERSRRHEFLAMKTGAELVKEWSLEKQSFTPAEAVSALNRLSNVRVAVWITDGRGTVIMPDIAPAAEILSSDLLSLTNYQSAEPEGPSYFRRAGITYFTCSMTLPRDMKILGNKNNWTVRFIEDTARTPLSSSLSAFVLFGSIVGLAAIFGLVLRRALAFALRPLPRIESALDHLSMQGKEVEEFNPLDVQTYPVELQNIASKFNLMGKRIGQQSKDINFFISAVSHEMRNQLTTIKGYSYRFSKLLKRQESQEKLENASSKIEAIVDDSLQTLANLVQLARSGSGSLSLNIKPVPSQPFLEQIASMNSSEKSFSVRLVNCANECIMADDQVLRSAMLSLIENAEKYACAGEFVEIYGHANQDRKCFMIDVRDFGDGIPEDSIEVIFDRFKRGSNSSGKYGTGLGLAVVKETLAAINCEIRAISNPYGKGACFRIIIPISQSKEC